MAKFRKRSNGGEKNRKGGKMVGGISMHSIVAAGATETDPSGRRHRPLSATPCVTDASLRPMRGVVRVTARDRHEFADMRPQMTGPIRLG